MNRIVARQLLIGRDDRRTKQWAVLIGALFFGSLLYFRAAMDADYYSILDWLGWEGAAVILGGLVVLQALDNEGLVISWGLVFAAVAGLVLNFGGMGMTGEIGVLEHLRTTVVLAGGTAALLGTIAFGVGVGVRRVIATSKAGPGPGHQP